MRDLLKKRTGRKHVIVSVVLLALTLAACGEKTPVPTEPSALHQEETQTTICQEVPQALVDRSPESVSGNSFGIMAETENGYYAALGNMSGQLCYADKSDLTNWVFVCNKPNCKHETGYGTCSADIQLASGFRLRDGRIYTLQRPENPSTKAKFAVCSMALDGTDLREERLVEEIPKGNGGGWSLRWSKDGLYYNYSTLGKDGNHESGIKRITGTGVDNLYTKTSMDEENKFFASPLTGTGDYAANAALLSGYQQLDRHLYRFTQDGYAEVPLKATYKLLGGLLKGDSLYRFTPGDGYYYTDLTTGESLKWMDAQFPEGQAEIFGTDLIMETNICYNTNPEVPEMRIYDGSEWKSVVLPEDIRSGKDLSFPCASVLTSQHLFFFLSSTGDAGYKRMLYAIDLTADTYEAVLCHSYSA